MTKRMYLWLSIIGSILIVSIILYRLNNGAVPYMDTWTIAYAAEIDSSSNLYLFFEKATHFGSRIFLVPFTIILSIPFYFLFRSMLPWFVLSGGTLLAHLLNMAIKAIVQRERPQIVPELAAEGFSFPSGHAMISLVFYSLLMYFLCKYFTGRIIRTLIVVCGSIFILIIGTSRYFLFVHYVSDIVGGYLIGFVLVIYMIRFCNANDIGKTPIRSLPPSRG